MNSSNDIRAALSYIPADDRDTWVRMGMAVKSQLGEGGYEVWDDWSQTSDKYKAREALATWKSLHSEGAVTIGTLHHEAVRHGWRPSQPCGNSPRVRVEKASGSTVRADDERQLLADQQRAISQVQQLLDVCKPAEMDHPYLVRKGLESAEGLYELDATAVHGILSYTPKSGDSALRGRLLIAPIKRNESWASCEFIDESGAKTALAGRGTKAGGYWAPAELPKADDPTLKLLLGEGIATVMSAHMATNLPVVAALSCNNLKAVAEQLRLRYPSSQLIILADLVKACGTPDKHAVAAAGEVGALLAVPDFGAARTEAQTDFNDLFACQGVAAVRRSIDSAKPFSVAETDSDTASDSAWGTDDQVALLFVEENGEHYKWTPHWEWMTFDDGRWVKDARRRYFSLIRKMCRDMAKQSSRLSAETGKTDKGASLLSTKRIAAIAEMAAHDQRLYVSIDEWDADLAVLNTPTGIIDLRTGEIRKRARHDLLTQMTPVGVDPVSDCQTWKLFLADVFGGDQELVNFIQRVLGYCLTGIRSEHKLFFLHGHGRNGKSTLVDLFSWLMGTYAIKLPSNVLMRTKNERHPTEIAQLAGKRLAVSSEIEEDQVWAQALIKELTGDELLRARFMRSDFFQFKKTHQHLVVGNFLPRFRGNDPAMAKRMVLIPFEQDFSDRIDPQLLDKLKAEGPAILHWVIQGAVIWTQQGLCIPERIKAKTDEYIADSDEVSQWISECCQLGPDKEHKATPLYQSYQAWKQSRGEREASQTLWGEWLAKLPGITKIRSNGIWYQGIAIKSSY